MGCSLVGRPVAAARQARPPAPGGGAVGVGLDAGAGYASGGDVGGFATIARKKDGC